MRFVQKPSVRRVHLRTGIYFYEQSRQYSHKAFSAFLDFSLAPVWVEGFISITTLMTASFWLAAGCNYFMHASKVSLPAQPLLNLLRCCFEIIQIHSRHSFSFKTAFVELISSLLICPFLQIVSLLFCVWVNITLSTVTHCSTSSASHWLLSNTQCPWQQIQQTPPHLLCLRPLIRAKVCKSGGKSHVVREAQEEPERGGSNPTGFGYCSLRYVLRCGSLYLRELRHGEEVKHQNRNRRTGTAAKQHAAADCVRWLCFWNRLLQVL